MKRRFLRLATVLGAGMLAFAWAAGPSPKGAVGGGQDGATSQVQTQVQERATVQTRAGDSSYQQVLLDAVAAGDLDQVRDQLRQQLKDGSCLDTATLLTILAGDQDRIGDKLRQQLKDGSCLDTATLLTILTGDQDHDQIRDRLQDGSCDGDSCQEHDYDYNHDGPPPDGGYGAS